MAKTIACVGAYGDDGAASTVTVPDDLNEVVSTLNSIVDKYGTGEALSDEDKEIVKAYLPAIGADETSLSSFDALIGSGTFDFDRADKGVEVHVEGECGCRDSGEGRIEWWAKMQVDKTGGDTHVNEYDFGIRGASFGVGPTGVMKLLYKRDFNRAFDGGDSAMASFDDRFTFTCWGFFFSCSCRMSTSEGDVLVR